MSRRIHDHASALLVAAVLVVHAPAAAQTVDPSATDPSGGTAVTPRVVQIGVAGGVVVPRNGASARTLKQGTHAEGMVLLNLPAGLPALRFNVDYARMRFRPASATSSGAGQAATGAQRSVLDGVAGVKLDLLRGPVRPYVTAGLGAFSVRDVVQQLAGATRATDATSFGVDGGVGLTVRLGPLAGFAEARLQNVYTGRGGLIDTRSIQAVPVSFGLVL